MNETLGITLIIWACGLLVTAAYGCLLLDAASWIDRRKGARVMILSPIWPLLLVRSAIHSAAKVWRTAEWAKR